MKQKTTQGLTSNVLGGGFDEVTARAEVNIDAHRLPIHQLE